MKLYNKCFSFTLSVTDAIINPAFERSFYNLENVSDGWIRIATLNTGKVFNGEVWLGTLRLKAVGNKSESSHLNLSVNSFIDSYEWYIPVTITNGVFTVGLPRTGDINGDGVVDLKDAIYLAKNITKISGYEEIKAEPDINCDGEVNLKDAIYLAKHVVGLEGYEKLYPCV